MKSRSFQPHSQGKRLQANLDPGYGLKRIAAKIALPMHNVIVRPHKASAKSLGFRRMVISRWQASFWTQPVVVQDKRNHP